MPRRKANSKRSLASRNVILEKKKRDHTPSTQNSQSSQNVQSSSVTEYIPSQNSDDNEEVLELLVGTFIMYFGPSWNNLLRRNLSVFVCALLKRFQIAHTDIEKVLELLNLTSFKTAKFWLDRFATGDIEGMDIDGRKFPEYDSFYDFYPDIESDAREWAVTQASSKSSSFSALKLAKFITEIYVSDYDVSDEEKASFKNGKLVRSVSSCKRDLVRWGFYLGNNSNRPFFEGHEREDVATARKEFVEYFTSRKHLYYTLTNKDDNKNECEWIHPMRKEDSSVPFEKVALFSHDESTYRRGEVCKTKWFFPGKEPLFQKGRMQSIMQSWFILQHPSGPFFQLSENEFKQACIKYPSLKEKDIWYDFEASGQIVLDGKNYFDNDKVLEQFERFCQMIEFSEALKDHKIEILFDHATTHTAKLYNINDFRKGEGYQCPCDTVYWTDKDSGELKSLDCYFEDNNGEWKSKGLLRIAQDLGVIPANAQSKDHKLESLKELLMYHPAFENVTKLEEIAKKYKNIKIIFVPKFHCELNPSEGVWAFGKSHTRRNNDTSSLDNFLNLLDETKNIIKEHILCKKLWRRFWNTLEAYKNGDTCLQVLQKFFGKKCRAEILDHRVQNTLL
jgi:hypothetical protein